MHTYPEAPMSQESRWVESGRWLWFGRRAVFFGGGAVLGLLGALMVPVLASQLGLEEGTQMAEQQPVEAPAVPAPIAPADPAPVRALPAVGQPAGIAVIPPVSVSQAFAEVARPRGAPAPIDVVAPTAEVVAPVAKVAVTRPAGASGRSSAPVYHSIRQAPRVAAPPQDDTAAFERPAPKRRPTGRAAAAPETNAFTDALGG